MKTVFLTGISGLLGINLANELLESGYSVKGLIREGSSYRGPLHQNLELVRGSLSDDLASCCQGCDFIVHSAAETRQDLIHYREYKEVNCNATIRLFNAGLKCGVKKFVFVSSANTIGHGTLSNPGTEKDAPCYPFTSLYYSKSKLEAEDCLFRNDGVMELVIINPGFMIGAYDTKPSSGKIILMGLNRKIIFCPPGGKSFVHVKDVAKGIVNSLLKGKHGERYLVINENLTYERFYQKLNQAVGQNPVMLKLPASLMLLLGYLGDITRFFGIRTNLSVVNMRALCVEGYYSNRKSVTELGIEYASLDSAISEAVNYFSMVKRGREPGSA